MWLGELGLGSWRFNFCATGAGLLGGVSKLDASLARKNGRSHLPKPTNQCSGTSVRTFEVDA